MGLRTERYDVMSVGRNPLININMAQKLLERFTAFEQSQVIQVLKKLRTF
jgi:hypothetical protein